MSGDNEDLQVKPKRAHEHEPPWTDVVIARSAVVQAVCAAFILIATVAILLATLSYTNYTRQQAIAEATSAAAAKSAADTAASALAETDAQATSQSTQFSQQLGKLSANTDATRNIATATLRVALATQDNAAATRGTVTEAGKTIAANEANFTAEQRPYLTASVPQFAPDNNSDSYEWTSDSLLIQNYGRSPAENITLAFNVWHDTAGNASQAADAFFKVPEAQMHWENMPPLAPGAGSSNPPGVAVFPHWGPYPRDTFLLLARTDDGIALYGRIKYGDRRGNAFHTDFCVYRLHNNTAAYCKYHNYIK